MSRDGVGSCRATGLTDEREDGCHPQPRSGQQLISSRSPQEEVKTSPHAGPVPGHAAMKNPHLHGSFRLSFATHAGESGSKQWIFK